MRRARPLLESARRRTTAAVASRLVRRRRLLLVLACFAAVAAVALLRAERTAGRWLLLLPGRSWLLLSSSSSGKAGLPLRLPPPTEAEQPEHCATPLSPSIPLLFVGGQGGSGTRGVWQLLRRSTTAARSSRASHDSLALRRSGLTRGLRGATPFLTARSLNFSLQSLHPALRAELRLQLCRLQELLAPDAARYVAAGAGGVLALKEPRSMYLLPLLLDAFPAARFLHLTRDPRTVRRWHLEGRPAMSARLFGREGVAALLRRAEDVYGTAEAVEEPRTRRRLLAAAVWAETQRALVRWCGARLGAATYRHVRVEALYVERDEAALADLQTWLGRAGGAGERAALLRQWRRHGGKYRLSASDADPRFLAWLDLIGGDVLDALGYPRGAALLAALPAQPPEPPDVLAAEAGLMAPAHAARAAAAAAGALPRSQLEIVLCRFDEDPGWAAALAPVLTVYNTGRALGAGALPAAARELRVPNSGRESGAYLRHIVANYDSLAELTVFSHAGAPTPGLRSSSGGGHILSGVFFLDYIMKPLFVFSTVLHMESTARVRRAAAPPAAAAAERPLPASCFDPGRDGRRLGRAPIFRRHVRRRCRAERAAECSLAAYWDAYVRLPRPPQQAVWFAQGARFSASASQIRRRPREDYERLLSTVNGSADPSAGYFLEAFWYYVITSEEGEACPQPPDMFGERGGGVR